MEQDGTKTKQRVMQKQQLRATNYELRTTDYGKSQTHAICNHCVSTKEYVAFLVGVECVVMRSDYFSINRSRKGENMPDASKLYSPFSSIESNFDYSLQATQKTKKKRKENRKS